MQGCEYIDRRAGLEKCPQHVRHDRHECQIHTIRQSTLSMREVHHGHEQIRHGINTTQLVFPRCGGRVMYKNTAMTCFSIEKGHYRRQK
jgi:hypothetical protein